MDKPKIFLESILDYLKIYYKYAPNERSYVITSKANWDQCAKIKIADLHPLKKSKFWNAYMSFKEEHYLNNYLKSSVFNYLMKPYTSKELSRLFNRSQARIYDVLGLLKRENKVKNFRVLSKDYWIRKDRKIIIISKVKRNYLRFLKDSNKTTKDFSRHFNVTYRSSFKRLKELERLRLVKRNEDKTWKALNQNRKVISL